MFYHHYRCVRHVHAYLYYGGRDEHVYLACLKSLHHVGLLLALHPAVKERERKSREAEIARVEGIDVLWIGHFDLTTSLGIPAQFEHPTYLEAVARVSKACRDHGKIGGFMAADVENAKWLLEQGFRMQAFGGDLWLYQQALQNGLRAVRDELT